MKTKRILPISLPGALLVLALVTPFVFTACNTESEKIDITMKSDYSKIVEAINDVNNTLSQKLTLIESAVSDGFADSKALQEMILKALESLSGTTSEQFAAIDGNGLRLLHYGNLRHLAFLNKNNRINHHLSKLSV